jgi:hypothetical protein
MIENDEPCMCGTDFTCMADEHECNCTGPWTQTVHASNPEGHQVGCPRWGARP